MTRKEGENNNLRRQRITSEMNKKCLAESKFKAIVWWFGSEVSLLEKRESITVFLYWFLVHTALSVDPRRASSNQGLGFRRIRSLRQLFTTFLLTSFAMENKLYDTE